MKTPSSLTPVVVLHTPLTDPAKLDDFVEDRLRRGVKLIAVCGRDAAVIEDIIDESVVGDGLQDDRFVVTSSHSSEPLQEVLEFAASWDGGFMVEEVRL